VADHLSDEEQLQVLKNWWSENGRFLIGAVVIGLTAYFGWQWWTQHQKNYAEGAAAIYTDLSEIVATANGVDLTEEQQKTAQFLIGQLQSDYEKTLYAANASMLAAKLAVEKNDLATAETELNKALYYDDEDVKIIASLRLAKVYLAQERYDQALTIATYDKDDAFTASYVVLRGDILVAMGDIELARSAYQQAVALLGSDLENRNRGLQRQLLEIKLSNLPEAGEQS
jgi:predicted negative regulator of RcsB-dependent stress response